MERSILENMVFAFMVGELGIEPITARKEVEKMTDEQLEKFIDQPKRSDLGASTAGRSPGADDGRLKKGKRRHAYQAQAATNQKKKGKGIIAQFPKWCKIMRKLTIAEKRERELRRAIEAYNIDYDVAKHLMNRFYRLNADLDRLSYLENEERTCNRKYTKDLSLSCDKRIDKLNKDLEPYGLALDSFSHLMTIVKKGTTKTAIDSFYYNQYRNRPLGGLAQAGNLATDETSRIYERMVDFMRIETEEQKKSRIFEHYKQYIKKPVNKGGCIRFIVIEYIVRLTDIDPFKMAAELKKDGYIIAFDDSSISERENERKRKAVEKIA